MHYGAVSISLKLKKYCERYKVIFGNELKIYFNF